MRPPPTTTRISSRTSRRSPTLVESTHRQSPRYSPADELYPLVDLQPDGKLRSLYTEEVWEPEELIEEAAELESQRASLRASAGEAQVEEMLGYNCEHVVPQSWFDHDEPMRGDLHHLFTCERKCNSFRGNTPFTDFPDYLQVVRESCGKSEGSGFEPWRGKGPAARATLYFTLRYPRLGKYAEETLEVLLGWHEAEPRRASTNATGTPRSTSARETGTRSSTTRSGRPGSASPAACRQQSETRRVPPRASFALNIDALPTPEGA